MFVTLFPLVGLAQGLLGEPITVPVIGLTGTSVVNLPIAVPAAATTVNVPINVLGNSINLPISVSVGPTAITVLGNNVTLPINVLGKSINLPVSVLGNTINVPAGTITVNVPITINLPVDELVTTINTVSAVVALRRSDILLGLDAGLARQIDILTPGGASDGGDNSWSKPSALGGPRLAGVMPDFWGGSSRRTQPFTDTESFSFAAGFHKAREANAAAASEQPPYALGATSRPPPARPAFDVWAEGSFVWFNDGSGQSERHGHWSVVYVGADYRVSSDVLVGTLVQFHQTAHQFDGFSSGGSDSGWMVGPYATVRLSNNLFFQARAAWGKSDVELGLDSSHDDHFQTERWLVRGTLLGQWWSGPWQFRPRASIGYVAEHQESYLSSLGATIPSQTVSLAQARLGPEIAYRYRMANGTVLEPSLLLEGIWNFMQDTGAVSIDDLAVGDRVRGRAETGVMVYTTGGAAFGASFSYDGIGSGDYQAIGGKVRVRVPFN